MTQLPASSIVDQSDPVDLEHLHQPACIGRGGALLVIVEINEDGPPLPAPSSNVARPGPQRPIRIMTFVASARPVPAYVDMARSYLPGRGRIVMVR